MANRLVSADTETGKLPGRVLDALAAEFAGKATTYSKDQADARYVPTNSAGTGETTVAKRVQGGVYPRPERFPTLTVSDSWPNARGPAANRVLWTENKGRTLYAFGSDSQLRKSLDGGESWTPLAYLNWGVAPQNLFLKLPTGTLLTVNVSKNIYRSTDDGVTWAIVGAMQSGQEVLGTQSIAHDPIRQKTYLAMYGGIGQSEMQLLGSSDDGLTWTVVHSFPGQTSTSDDKITHLHAVQYDPYMQRVIISAGDSSPATGLYRTTSDGNSVEPVVLNRMLPAEQIDAPRTIGVIPFPDYLAWASDSTSNSYLFRMARTEIGKANPVVERIYRLNSTAWWSCKASDDGSRWVISASQENTSHSLDRLTHLYAVEDQGATVYEVGALAPISDNSNASSLMPVGQAEQHGEILVMSTRGTGGAGAAWKFRLGLGSGATIPWPADPTGEVVVQKTIGTGPVLTQPATSSTVLGYEIVPSQATSLYVFDAQIITLSGSNGNASIGIRRKDTGAILYSATTRGERYTKHLENGGAVARITLAAGVDLELYAANAHGAATTVNGSITYGLGLAPTPIS
jgi:hypothetical protein